MNLSQPIRLAVIIGSVREGRFGPTVAHWFAQQVRQHEGFEIDLIDLADFPLPAELSKQPDPATAEVLACTVPRLAAADAFVIVTPEYNRAYPASVKSLLDWHYEPWRAKPVGFVSYGGMTGGLLAVNQLRQVLPELHALTVRDTVSFHNVWQHFGADGTLREPDGANGAAKVMLDQLGWWAGALRTAKEQIPYATA
ncbi:NADPH-dependent oxidoreductase [Pseudonocardiaceae bacterium YIM PH 21723]|nr:NADPH-dependent oxidoreductase [Pseudonocardiaceae bacterium YIM PH 21723]